MCIGLHVEYPLFLSHFNETNFPDKFRKIIDKISWKSVQWEQSCYTRTNGRAGVQTKLTVDLRYFANAPHNATIPAISQGNNEAL